MTGQLCIDADTDDGRHPGAIPSKSFLKLDRKEICLGQSDHCFGAHRIQEPETMNARNAIFPANRHALYDMHGYSAAIASGDLLFVSGQVGSRSDGTPEPDFAEQVRLAFSNLEATLAAGGCTFGDIVDVTTFHTDPENQLETIMTEKNRTFSEPPYPNWTAIGVTWLAGFDFEIKVIARIPDW